MSRTPRTPNSSANPSLSPTPSRRRREAAWPRCSSSSRPRFGRRDESLFAPVFADARLRRLFARLAAQGFSPRTAAQLVGELEGLAASGASDEDLERACRRRLQRMWRVSGAAPEPETLALIGPAGSGKTATLAKLAAHTL